MISFNASPEVRPQVSDFTRSSGFGRLNFDGTVNYKSKKQEISLSASGIYTITDSSFSRATREDIGSEMQSIPHYHLVHHAIAPISTQS